MGLGLVILGTLFGLVSAFVAVMTGQVGVFGGLGLYSATGVLVVIVGTIFIVMRDNENADGGSSGTPRPVPVTR